jgi:hypothetical protein
MLKNVNVHKQHIIETIIKRLAEHTILLGIV